MSDNERILELKKCADKLGIRVHLASMNFDKGELEPTLARDVFGMVFVDNLVTNEMAFYLQQQGHNDGRAK